MQEKNVNIANTAIKPNQHGKVVMDDHPHIHGPDCQHNHEDKKADFNPNQKSILECSSCKKQIKGRPFESYGKPLCKECFIKIHTPVINQNKIGRNDKCICGSNLKFKHCCLKKQNEIDSKNAIEEYNNKNSKEQLTKVFDELAKNTKPQ